MSDIARPALPTHIHSWTRWMSSQALRLVASLAAPSSNAWTTANLAIYLPLNIPWNYPVNRAFWFNGSAAGSNVDIGIYSVGGGQIWHAGSTAGSGNSAMQYVTVSPNIVLSPGQYFIALTTNATTANRMTAITAPTASNGRLLGYYQQATAFPLPASASFAAYSSCVVPLCGISLTTSGFA